MSYREPVPQQTHLPDLLEGMTDQSVPDINVHSIALDSRQVDQGSLFLACQGSRAHGLEYWPQAQERGASALVWEPGDVDVPDSTVPTIAIEQLSGKISEIASRFYGHPGKELFVAGITGTDGKTSCAWLLAQACAHLGQRCGYMGTLGYGFPGLLDEASHTTPDPVRLQYWLARLQTSGAQAVAMEVSSHALDQGRAEGVMFDVALLTNFGRDHLDYHGDLESYAAAKRRLFDMPGLAHAVLNADDAMGLKWLSDLPATVQGAAFGFDEAVTALAVPYVHGREVRCTSQGIEVEVSSSWGEARLVSPLLGRFNAANLLACLAVLLVRGEDFDAAVSALSAASAVPGRMEAVPSEEGQPLVIVDYAHTPQALQHALQAARAHATGQLYCVFGCGGDRDRGKRPLMGQVVAEIASRFWITDDNPRQESPADIIAEIIKGLPEGAEYIIEHSRADAIAQAIELAGPDDVVLVAGKGHEDYQIVGNERLPFDDRQVAAAILARLFGQEAVH